MCAVENLEKGYIFPTEKIGGKRRKIFLFVFENAKWIYLGNNPTVCVHNVRQRCCHFGKPKKKGIIDSVVVTCRLTYQNIHHGQKKETLHKKLHKKLETHIYD